MNKIVWLGVLVAALIVLVLAQARTETISFLAGFLVILMLRKRRRVVLLGFGSLGAILLALEGFSTACGTSELGTAVSIRGSRAGPANGWRAWRRFGILRGWV